MNVLVLGSGGREHALALKISESKLLKKLYVMPGNPGTSKFAKNVDINPLDKVEVLKFCLRNQINLIIPGCEIYLEKGISDYFIKAGIHVFGPIKKAAKLESSKEYAKQLMEKYNIPTAKYEVFKDYKKALKYIDENEVPIVIKYDGLAGGKGVVVAFTKEEAKLTLDKMLVQKKYGDSKVIIEEYLEGPEFSLMCFVDNNIVIPMPICQDHKRLLDNDLGPNTGGMGIYSPVPIIEEKDIDWSIKNIMEKTVEALKNEGILYTGFLYGGLIKTIDGPKVIEFNVRFGDPEAEVLMPKLESDILEIIDSLRLKEKIEVSWNKDYVLGVVLASNGYPVSYDKGKIIENANEINNLYHMGTKKEFENLVTNGGRVLFVYGKGKTLLEAKENAYRDIERIKCKNLFYRKDIGYKSINA
ncbi:phosphoribosylamine--glycine ligase [Candidatus Izemoplasma sp. B36]|uniref:phosphoribosylamine--glycine ligase n=1 Tax=Candidatus Izemoplasma sp. B36 TaxID=3242468 RepID=UPI00355768AF